MESAATLPPSLTRYAWLSIAAAIATILLKGVAWWLTGSVGLLSDAIESFVNLAGALMALWMLTLAARPADDNHAYGYSKAEYFSSAFEGCLILLAAVSIGYAAIVRLMNPQSLEDVGIGLLAACRTDRRPGRRVSPYATKKPNFVGFQAFPRVFPSFSLLQAQYGQALQIPRHTNQRPLAGDLVQTAQREAAKAHHRLDDPEHRFDGLLA